MALPFFGKRYTDPEGDKTPKKPVNVVQSEELKREIVERKIFGGLEAAIVVFVVLNLAFWLNFFGIVNLSARFPILSFLPQTERAKEENVAISIGDTKITRPQYEAVASEMEEILGRDAASARTSTLFIENAILSAEAQKYEINTKDNFDIYLASLGEDPLGISSRKKLELENAFLKEELTPKIVSWYTGHYFIVMFRRLDGETNDGMRLSAQEKIADMRQMIEGGRSRQEVLDKYLPDATLTFLNSEQAFSDNFVKLNLAKPTFRVDEIFQVLPSLAIGQISDILTLHLEGGGEKVPYAYSFVQVTDKYQGETDDFDVWLEQKKQETKIFVR